jgi:hypothetical protein
VKETRLRVVGFAIIIEDQLEHRCMGILRRMRREDDYGFPGSPTNRNTFLRTATEKGVGEISTFPSNGSLPKRLPGLDLKIMTNHRHLYSPPI